MSPGVLQVCSTALCPVCVIHAGDLHCWAVNRVLPDNISMLLLCALHEQDADGCALLPTPHHHALESSAHVNALTEISIPVQDMYALDTDRAQKVDDALERLMT